MNTLKIVGLPHVTFLDSTGIAALVAGYHAAPSARHRLPRDQPPPPREKGLQLTGVLSPLTDPIATPPVTPPQATESEN